MKKLILMNVLFIFTLVTNAAIWRVSKDVTYLPHYSDVQVAVDGASIGDTIYVYPGSYGNVIVKKKIAIFGVGYLLVENAKDSLTKFVSPSAVGAITFKPGGNNSVISGLTSGRVYCDTVSNICISGNRLNGITLKSSNNVLIHRNYSDQYIDGSKSNGITINNNIISQQIGFDAESSLEIYNNYIGYNIVASSSNIYNNIMVNNNGNNGLSNCLARNNIYLNSGFTIGTSANGNFQSGWAQIWPKAIINDNFKLTEGSTAIGKGVGGADCGPFGGDDPYVLSGINYIPTIVALKVPNQASNESGLKLKVIVKSNN